ncbi:hypothetical protein [Frankia sp. Cj3]|uniref:hypothetical protein n=1 Tax=Frankia sp. Cj3 TaxID=2880976 RepID=UPI001EF58ECB|nr:hypothetical protein [Frankia sp. Cj3]
MTDSTLARATPTVVEIDLRTRYAEVMDVERFSDIQRVFIRDLGVAESDPGRVLLIDDSRSLVEHAPGLERIITARSVNQVVCLVVGPPNAEYAQPAHVDGHGYPTDRGGADRGGDPDPYAADTYDHDRRYVADHGQSGYGESGYGECDTGEPGYDDVTVGHPDMDDRSWVGGGYGERPGRGEAGGGPPRSDRSSESVRAAANRSGGDRGRYGSRPGRGGGGAGAASSTGGSSVGAFPADGSGPRGGTRLDPARIGLVKPFVLRAPVATLWVSDARGVGWGMGQTQPQSLPSFLDDADDGPVLSALRDALCQHEVFDAVAEKVGSMADATAAPGLRAVVGRVDDGVLADAQLRALDRLLAPHLDADGASEPPSDLVTGPLPLFLGMNDRRADTVLRPDGLISSSLQACGSRIADAAAAVAGMRGWRVLFTGRQPGMAVRSAMRQAAAQLAELRENLRAEFIEIDGSRGLDQARRNHLAELGVVTSEPAGTTARSVVNSLRLLTDNALDAGHSVVEVSQWLSEIARRLYPRGSREYVDDLDRICPDDILDNLDNPDRLRLSLAAPWVLGPVALFCFLAALWSPLVGVVGAVVSLVPALAIVMIVVLGGWLLLNARQVSPDEAGALDFLALLAVALVAAGGGWYLQWSGRLGIIPASIRPALAAVGLAGLLLWPLRVWVSAVRRWQPWSGGAVPVVDDLRALVCRVALYEWVLADSRRDAHDATNALTGALLDMQTKLTDHAMLLRGHPIGEQPDAVPGIDVEVAALLRDQRGEIARVVQEDLVDLIQTALQRCWKDLERGAPDALPNYVSAEAEHLLDVYAEHLARRGVHEAPPFGRPGERRAVLVDAVWTESRRVAGVLRATRLDVGIQQLCGPEELSYLDVAPDRADLIRFAPRVVRAVLGRGAARAARHAGGSDIPFPGSDLVWTTGGQVAGVLRLVRLRSGVVETPAEGRL